MHGVCWAGGRCDGAGRPSPRPGQAGSLRPVAGTASKQRPCPCSAQDLAQAAGLTECPLALEVSRCKAPVSDRWGVPALGLSPPTPALPHPGCLLVSRQRVLDRAPGSAPLCP